MSARNAKRIWNSCLLLAMTSVPLTVDAADKQPEKTRCRHSASHGCQTDSRAGTDPIT